VGGRFGNVGQRVVPNGGEGVSEMVTEALETPAAGQPGHGDLSARE
jgi:hypothetical protein